MKTKAYIESFGESSFTFEVDDKFFMEFEHNNLNPDLLDEFCDLVEEEIVQRYGDDDDDWYGYKYNLHQVEDSNFTPKTKKNEIKNQNLPNVYFGKFPENA